MNNSNSTRNREKRQVQPARTGAANLREIHYRCGLLNWRWRMTGMTGLQTVDFSLFLHTQE
jgi:hypothetical protein